ncbi:hypothetical protein [Sphingomonas sp. CV7422]|uniref:hypothetical protein n=1 Tax=Sphingomonas sp. CV7422 TaxID=3018036 RepID=UPI0022FDFCC8|nr:hypothetical protein [Sphingomonas sp. CV7422]
MERDVEYLRRREQHARGMARRADCRKARRAHRLLASAYAARRAALSPEAHPLLRLWQRLWDAAAG